jgi:hypothetical protein
MTTSPPPTNSAPPPSRGAYSPPETRPSRPRPTGLEISFWLWITYLAIGASNAVIEFIHRDRNRTDLINAAIAKYPGMDQAMIGNMAGLVVAALIVIGLLFAATGLTFALLMRGGRNWARIALTVVGSVSVLFLVGPVGTDLQALFQLLLLVGAIMMMFQRPVNQWFRPRRPQI